MNQPRRDFLRVLGVASSFAMSGALPPTQSQRHKFPDPPQPAEANENRETPVNPQVSQRAQLKSNEKEFRESLDHLYDRVSELKQDLKTMHTAEIFSVKVYKQTGEIEHLAKRLRSLAKF